MALKYKTWLLVLVLLCFSSSIFAQNNPPSKSSTESEQTVKIDTTLVNIPVIAVDKKGEFLSDLKAEDFVVYENGVKQKIELFSAENAPANILIMMESASNNPSVLPYAKELAKSLVEKMRIGDNIAIISFEDKLVANTTRFTEDQKELKQAIEKASSTAKGARLRDAVFTATEKVLKQVPGRKVLVLVSTGDDIGSSYSEKDTVARLIESDTVVYSLFYPQALKFKEIASNSQQNKPKPTT